MFDISWTEFLLIGVVALIVIGPKELPGVLRTLGQWTRKVRGMAADFQNQFQEAMREAEMADLKKEVDSVAKDFSQFDPLKGVRQDFDAMGKDIQTSLEKPVEQKPAEPPAADADAAAGEDAALKDAQAGEPLMLSEPAATPADEAPKPETENTPAGTERPA
jgi:sec-independent protein translocase protein TatB